MKSTYRLAMALAALALTGRAATYYVASDGSDTNSGAGWTDAFATVSNAVAQVTGTGPHAVYVSNGLYAITSEIVLTNSILVRSWNNGALDEAGTIVDGQSLTRGFKLTHSGAVLAGFTVRNGTNAAQGGGVYVTGGGTVTQCVLTGNSAREGGGICITNGGLVTHSTLSENIAVSNSASASLGGGVYVMNTGVVNQCVVADNRVVSKTGSSCGGGIVLYVNATNNEMRVYGTQVSNNVSEEFGGGIFISQNVGGLTQAVISGSTVASNYSGSVGGGIYMSGSVSVGLKGTITGCVVKGNYAIGGNDGAGAGIGVWTLARNCTISGNSAAVKGAGGLNVTLYDSVVESNRCVGAGAGLYYGYGGHVISNCVIRGNTADGSMGQGSAIYFYYTGPKTVIKNCEIRENVACRTPGITTANINSTGLVYNCLVCDNVCTQVNSSDSRGVLWGPFALSSCTIVSNVAGWASYGSVYLRAGSSVTNCIIYSNKVAGSFGNELKYETGVTSNVVFYSCVPNGIPPDQGNITDAPKFRDFDAGDYRLAADSPTVNAGINEPWMDGARDLDGRPRRDPFSQRVDMGAYEFLPAGALFQLR